MGGSSSKPNRPAPNYRAAPSFDLKPKPQGGEGCSGVKLSKEVVDFHLEDLGVIPLNKPILDQLEITNNNNYTVKYKFEPCFQREFQLTFTPAEGTIKPNKSKIIKAKLNVHIKVNLNFRVTLNIEGGGSIFIIAKIRCETGVFGVDPNTLESVEDNGFKVPVVLAKLRQAFIERGGLEQEGVFRLAGEQTELKSLKQKMNAGDMTMPQDVNSVATLIKIWYRELPQPVLNALPNEKIFYSGEIQDCVEAVASLPEPQKTLLDWLVMLMILVAENRRVNKMTAQNLAIVVAPNLYEATTPDPMEGLVMSQKAVQFIHNVLLAKIKEREKVLGRSLDVDLGKDEAAPQPLRLPAGAEPSSSSPPPSSQQPASSAPEAAEKQQPSEESAPEPAAPADQQQPQQHSSSGKKKHKHRHANSKGGAGAAPENQHIRAD